MPEFTVTLRVLTAIDIEADSEEEAQAKAEALDLSEIDALADDFSVSAVEVEPVG
jgi:hypothetical protein